MANNTQNPKTGQKHLIDASLSVDLNGVRLPDGVITSWGILFPTSQIAYPDVAALLAA